MKKSGSVGTVISFPTKFSKAVEAVIDEADDFPLGRFFRLGEGGGEVVFTVNEPVTIRMTPAQAEELGLTLIQAAYVSNMGK